MFGRRSQDDFEDEIRSHLALEAERLRRRGMSPPDAERAARRAFGNIGVAEDRFYQAQRFSWLQDAGRDVRHAWRALRRHPVFLLTTVGTLALAMGAVTGMSSVVKAVLFEPLPFPAPDRLVSVSGVSPGSDLPERFDPGAEFYLQYKERSALIDGIFTGQRGSSTFRTGDRVERIEMAWPSNDMYSTLGVRPAIGRLPVPEDGDAAVLISDQLWSSWFGRDSSVIGKSFFVSDSMKQVIGIMPPDFRFPSDNTMLWISGEVRSEDIRLGRFDRPVFARLKAGVTPGQLANELTRIAREVPERFGGTPAFGRIVQNHRAFVEPVLDRMVGPAVRTSLWLLLGSVSVVLLIACANVANLFLVRAEGRARDMALRRAIGATRSRLVRLQLAESALVAMAGGVLAIVISRVSLPLFLHAAPEGIPRLAVTGIDAWAIITTLGVAMLVALTCGLVPALRASAPDLRRLRDGGRGATGGRRWGRDLLVIGQTALALVLLIGSALLMQSFDRLRRVDPGYQTANLYTFQFAPDQPALNDGPARRWGELHSNVMDRLRALPGVSAVGAVNNLPLDESTPSARVQIERDGAEVEGPLIKANFSGGDYFTAVGVELLQGRVFTRDELQVPHSNVVVSRSAALKLWPGRDAIGQRLRPEFDRRQSWFTVVGVVDDVKQEDWRGAGDVNVYFGLIGSSDSSWSMSSPAYVVKSSRAEALREEVRAIVHSVAPEAPVYREYTLDYLARRSMIELSFTMLTLGVVSALALLLGAIGLYGVLSYVVAERTREIGVRMALGATAKAVRRQVVSQGVRVVLVGVAIGLGAAASSTHLMQALLYGISAVDPLVFATMAAVMVLIGVAASYLPARRASGVDPMVSLRND
ncbi:MAG: ABC transporter permease [Gemmatimonadaceae bacterium]|nr:ABC transporter permease [Gemmatimonadaceae bacterium]